MSESRFFEAGEILLQSGHSLHDVRLAYGTYGTLNEDKSNAVVILTPFGMRHTDCEYFFGPGKALDPARHFIIVPNLLGNGLSSSPSNTPSPFDRGNFPHVSIYDNVMLQHRFITEVLDIDKLLLVMGHSMGALQTYQWAVLFPDMMAAIAPICGSARTSPHNKVFLQGMRGILELDPAWKDGWYDTPPEVGLKTLGRAWAASPPSQGFYRESKYNDMGYNSIEDFLVGHWENMFVSRDANDILSHISTWYHADLSDNEIYCGDFEKALGTISAKAIVMPSQTDIYFPPEDGAYEAAHIPNAEFRPIPSIWGHWAGNARNPEDAAFIDQALAELLAG